MLGLAQLWPFRTSLAKRDAERLVATVSAMGRRAGLFAPGRAPDTLTGRFEMIALHACCVFIRLQAEERLAPLAQAFADTLFRHLDSGLREAGVGDLAVPKRMRKLAGLFYGRLKAYAAPIAARDAERLGAALQRHALGEGAEGRAYAARLAGYVLATVESQARLAPEALFAPEAWGAAPD